MAVTRVAYQQHGAPEVTSNIRVTFVSFDDQHGPVVDPFPGEAHRLDESVVIHAAVISPENVTRRCKLID